MNYETVGNKGKSGVQTILGVLAWIGWAWLGWWTVVIVLYFCGGMLEGLSETGRSEFAEFLFRLADSLLALIAGAWFGNTFGRRQVRAIVGGVLRRRG